MPQSSAPWSEFELVHRALRIEVVIADDHGVSWRRAGGEQEAGAGWQMEFHVSGGRKVPGEQ